METTYFISQGTELLISTSQFSLALVAEEAGLNVETVQAINLSGEATEFYSIPNIDTFFSIVTGQ